jgi:hypothetical protein
MAHARMAPMSILTVRSSAAEASAYFGVGVGQCCDKSLFNLCMPLTAPDHQKWLWCFF